VRLTLKRLRWKNFLSYGNEFTEIDLDSHHLNLISGSNGQGKSVTECALLFSLFGQTLRGVKKLQLVNSSTNRDCLTEVEFEAGGVSYLVRRGLRPTVFEIYREGELVDQDAATRDYQQFLEKKILRTNFKTFTQAVVLGSTNYTPFMRLPAGQRREVVEDLLDLKIFTGMNSVLKGDVQEIEREGRELETQRRLVSQKIELLEGKAQALDGERELRITDKEREISETETLIETRTLEVRELEDRLLSRKTLWNDTEIKRVVETKTKYRDHSVGIKSRLHSLRKDVEFFHDNDTCPTCRQTIEDEFKSTVIAEKSGEISEVEEGLRLLEEKLSEIEKRHNVLATEQMNHDRETRDLSSRKSIAEHDLRGLEKKVSRLRDEITRLREQKVELRDEAQIQKLRGELVSTGTRIQELDSEREMMELVGVLLKDNGVKARVVSRFVPLLNDLVNGFLAKLDFYVDFRFDENFQETIKSRGRDVFSYDSFSEGEKLRIDLAILFAWRALAKRRASLDVNLLFADEILDGALDTTGMGELLKILRDVVDGNIFIISHRSDQIDGFFDRNLYFEKTRGFSKMEVR
jgi:DNA repair exonuclease SbcCD ATPase subunit